MLTKRLPQKIQRMPQLLLPPLLLLLASLPATKGDVGVPERSTTGGILPKDVSRSVIAIQLREAVGAYNEDDSEDTVSTEGIYLESGTDAVHLARVGDEYCAAAFRGTTVSQPSDWETNFLYDGIDITAVGMTAGNADDASDLLLGCDTHQGYHDAYANFEYRDTVEDFFESCLADCPDCETLLTGHSQGGGIAAVAALYLKLGSTRNATNHLCGSAIPGRRMSRGFLGGRTAPMVSVHDGHGRNTGQQARV